MKRSSFDVPAENECPECQGQGETRYTAPVLAEVGAVGTPLKWETQLQGSGCPKCLGVGRL